MFFQITSKAIWIVLFLGFSLFANAEAAAIERPNATAGISDNLLVLKEEFEHGIAKRSPALSPAIAVPPFAPATFKYCKAFMIPYVKKLAPIWPKLGGPVGVAYGKYLSKTLLKMCPLMPKILGKMG